MKVHLTPPSPRAIKVLAVLHHLGLDPEMSWSISSEATSRSPRSPR